MSDRFWVVLAFLNGIPWMALVTAVISLGFLWTARQALCTWRRELKTRREMQFMDDLNDAIHEYLVKIHKAINAVGHIKTGLESYSTTRMPGNDEHEYSWVERYISGSGKDASRELSQLIADTSPARMRMGSLACKGQVLGIDNYHSCLLACKNLIDVHDRIQALATMIGKVSYNWENDHIRSTFDKATKVSESEFRDYIVEQNIVLLEFMQKQYQLLLK